MKINFNSTSLALSGGNRFLFELSNALVDRGHRVSFTHADKSWVKNWFYPIKAEIIECGPNIFSSTLNRLKKNDILEDKQKRIRINCPDCDINVASLWATVKPTYESKKGRPVYIVQHYAPSAYPEHRIGYLKSFDYPLTKLCVSKWVAEKVGGYNIGNGINLNKFKRNPEIAKIPKSIMFSARSPKWKNTEIGLSALSTLKKVGYKILLTNERYSDRSLIQTYNQAEVYVNFSDREGFGYGPLEAMACGCVVVSTPCSEYLIDNGNCIIVPFKSSIADIISTVNKLYANSAQLSKLRKAGYETAKHYDIEKVVDRFISLMEKN